MLMCDGELKAGWPLPSGRLSIWWGGELAVESCNSPLGGRTCSWGLRATTESFIVGRLYPHGP